MGVAFRAGLLAKLRPRNGSSPMRAAIPDAGAGPRAKDMSVFTTIHRWVQHRNAIRRRWQADARHLAAADEVNAYYEAQRRAARARHHGDRDEFYHWVKVAAEVAYISPLAEMDFDVVRRIADEEDAKGG